MPWDGPVSDLVAAGDEALADGRWEEAKATFAEVVRVADPPEAHFGLAMAAWWLGENQLSVDSCTKAYARFRRHRQREPAAHCAIWLAITYKANFGNTAAANGWLGRADRLLSTLPEGALHGWSCVARAYRNPDLASAAVLAASALDLARALDDADLELTALSQLGLIRVGAGELDAGFALIDEAVAAALGGEGTSLDTVVYTCCDMLNACELASDLARASQWCQVADAFVEEHGCPFLYAECRIFYGSVLTANGRWTEAAQELDAGLRMTADTCPGLHDRALARLAGVRVRQGRLEEAQQLLDRLGAAAGSEAEAARWRAMLLLARGDAAGATRVLGTSVDSLVEHRSHLGPLLDLLVDAALIAHRIGDATADASRLELLAGAAASPQLTALATAAAGRVAAARGDHDQATTLLTRALEHWTVLHDPFEVMRCQLDLARATADEDPGAAAGHARRALGGFEQLGASIEADRAAAFLRAAGHVPRTGVKGAGVLTIREQEVLRLVGLGFSNPEIGSRLHISAKTASHHVSSILRKLGLRNRTEAATYEAAGRGSGAGRD